MPECPICRREFDESLRVFAPPGRESYDTIECARRAASVPGAELLAPMLLPTIELLPLGGAPAGAPQARLAATSRRRLAAAIAIPLVASPAAVAAGLSLVAAGTATSVYLGAPAFEGSGGQVVAAPAPAVPAQPAEAEPASEAPTPPPSTTPVTGKPEQAKPEPRARVVVLAATPRADTSSHVESSAEAAPTETAEAPPTAGLHEAPPRSHGSPASPANASPHRPAAPPPHPVAPPPQTTPPSESAEEVVASPSPPPSHDPHSASAPAVPTHNPHDAKGKDKDKDQDDDDGGDDDDRDD